MSICPNAPKNALTILALALGTFSAASATNVQSLTDKFRQEFMNHNPVLTEIWVLESKPLPSSNRLNNYVYLVRAIRPDHRFEGKFEDEQFGIFLVNSSRNKILKVIDMFNTPRWADFTLKIKQISPSATYVVGSGSTYGDQPLERTYKIVEGE